MFFFLFYFTDNAIVSSFSGAFTPVTMEGNIVVDGVLASCYAYCDHDMAHFGMTPIRWFPTFTQWIFGENNSSPEFVYIVEYFYRWVTPYGQQHKGKNVIPVRASSHTL